MEISLVFFRVVRGCRQGDPISPYIFILCAEILSIILRNNKNIKGITINQQEHLLSQYADDTSVILDGTRLSLESTIKDLNFYASISGLNLNFTKTQIIWIGNQKYSDAIYETNSNLQWGITKFNLLGIEFDVDLNKITKLNFDKKLVKLKSLISNWKRRILSPIGRITIVKTLLISQMNLLFIALPNPDENFIKKLNTILYEFIWKSKTDRVKRDVMIKEHFDGGLNMINVKCFIMGLKVTWVRRLFRENSNWICIVKSVFNMDYLANCGSQYIKIASENTQNLFWKDVFKAWYATITASNEYKNNILLNPIWHNENIKVGGQSVFYRSWYAK